MKIDRIDWTILPHRSKLEPFPVTYTQDQAVRFLRLLALLKSGDLRTPIWEGDVIANCRVDRIVVKA